MFVIYEKDKQKLPIKIWLNNVGEIEPECLQQALNLSNLPFAYKWISLMPDCHYGFGVPIGGILATENVIIPNAVGLDISCGMGFVQTNIPVSLIQNPYTMKSSIPDTLLQQIIGQTMRNIPVGFKHHKEKQICKALDNFKDYYNNCNLIEETTIEIDFVNDLKDEIERGYYQIGTLGGGNHFLEFQEDEKGMLCIMVHSGSRNFGYKIAKYFDKVAKELNKKWFSQVPKEWDLAFLPTNSLEGQSYIMWMRLAMNFAKENRQVMMEKIKEIVFNTVQRYTDFKKTKFSNEINAHHNYADIENHYNKNVWIHRKGAIRVREGEIGIIPGAMGSYSYIVKGLGNPESFYSCSHGAGRKMSRKKAKEEIPIQTTIEDLNNQKIVLGKHNKEDVSEECRFAYKNIDTVIQNQLDLITPIKKLKTIGVIKG